MAQLNVSGNKKVKTLKAEFKNAFGSSLRVYKSVKCVGPFADDEATLGSIATKEGGDLTVGGNKTVGRFEEEFRDIFGIGVQVANAANTELADNSVTLVQAGRE